MHAFGMCRQHYRKAKKTGMLAPRVAPPKVSRVERDDVFRGKWPKVKLSLTPEDIYARPGAEFG